MKNKRMRHNISLGLALGLILFTSVNAAHMSGVDRNSKHIKIFPSFIRTAAPVVGGCQIFPQNNFWNTPVNALPVHSLSSAWINSIGATQGFHMDFGSGTWNGGPIGIPFNVISGSQTPKYVVDFYYPGESDAGPYPIPLNPAIEYGSDHHILSIDTDDCKLYEIYDAWQSSGNWFGGSGAIWDLNSNALRPDGWTSADAAGLPIFPGLVRYEEIAAGEITHALRFTTNCTANYYLWPARHVAQSGSCASPVPFGARFRLKADYNISGFSPQARIILQAMKTYGIVLADNGSPWYVSGAPSESWNNDMLHELDVVTGNNFEAVDTAGLVTSEGPLMRDTTGVFRPGNGLLYLKNSNTTGFADVAINYGLGGDYPVTGDWNGDGIDTIGIYRNGSFYLRNSNTLGFADIVFAFGQPGDQPVAGDWDGNGVDTIGVYRNGLFLLRNSNSAGAEDISFYLGNPGDVGIAGDWNGDGADTTGVFRPSNGVIFLKNLNTSGFADININYGLSGDMPVTGDWNNDGIDTIGVYRNAQFLLRNSNTIGFADIVFALGNPGDMPIAGNWDALP
ncbi:hypothetical protein [Candidatus Villigracilis saccharophilus]|uniref:hypothetical protein n=1 Tax=Candidatus Villigracilis saccharophilus TaxID=3140684 RepID=UPI0031E9DAD1